MSEINVASRTQKIIVDPVSNSVSIIYAGPIGPTGPSGGVSLEEVRDELVSTLVEGSNIEITHDDVNDTITISSTAAGTGDGAGGYTFVQDETNPPLAPETGDTWFAPDTGKTYLRYFDGISTVWMQSADAAGDSGSTTSGGYTYVQDTTPSTANLGETWFNTSNGVTYLYYDNGVSVSWVQSAISSGDISELVSIDGGSAFSFSD